MHSLSSLNLTLKVSYIGPKLCRQELTEGLKGLPINVEGQNVAGSTVALTINIFIFETTHEFREAPTCQSLRLAFLPIQLTQINKPIFMQVFFIRDGYQFPDMVHALRPNPKNNIQEGWRILDWFAAHPEGLNLFTYLLGDEGNTPFPSYLPIES